MSIAAIDASNDAFVTSESSQMADDVHDDDDDDVHDDDDDDVHDDDDDDGGEKTVRVDGPAMFISLQGGPPKKNITF